MALEEWGEDEENSKLPSDEEMAAIPEASSELSAARRSKRRVGKVDEEVGVAAERRKALRNEGNSAEHTPTSPNSVVISNLNAVGICLGDDDISVGKSLLNIKEKAVSSL
jgi:hypothetical protein